MLASLRKKITKKNQINPIILQTLLEIKEKQTILKESIKDMKTLVRIQKEQLQGRLKKVEHAVANLNYYHLIHVPAAEPTSPISLVTNPNQPSSSK